MLKDFAKRKRILFPLLSDEKSEVIRSFALLNEEVPKNSAFYGVPHPVTLLVDGKGVVLSRHYEENYRQRFTTSNILSKTVGLPTEAAANSIEGKHVAVSLSASDEVVRGGERILLRVKVRLPPRIHVYAPGVLGYIPIDWRMDNTPAADSLPVTYPKSRIMRLKAIKESVPVYDSTFVLEREVIVSQKNPPGALLITGTFRYQACDDKICYIPESVPLEWKLTFEPHDSTRVPPELRRKVD